ncbi:protein disks lost [Episyrphus balteatus]|uniref:protein disks lost n=1 Tax=Episyrphus balteatus TaxID=286459 RepID=UPI002485905C|nr:protein disks lost [Episyrphus balteatus]
MADQLLNFIITTKEPFEPAFSEWFLKQIKSNSSCTLEEFGLFFLNFIRQQTEVYTKTPGTPKCVSSPIGKTNNTPRDSSSTRTPRRIFPNNLPQQQLTPDNRFRGDDSLQLRCTPTRNTSHFNDTLNQSNHKGFTSTPHKSFNKSSGGNTSNEFNRSSNNSGFCLGDFIVSNSRTRKKQQQQKDSSANISDGNNSDQKPKNKAEKPKKRVVPTQVSKTTTPASHSFSSPTLSSENNILKMFNDAEIVDKGKCSVMEARKSLKTNILEISKELEEENRPNLINQSLREAVKRMEKLNMTNDGETTQGEEPKIDFEKLTHRKILDCLAEIYSFLIDVHITANVLSELSYLLGILNADNNSSTQSLTPQFSSDLEFHLDEKLNVINRTNNEAYTALKSLTNCIYFSLEVLKRQRHLLALLDVKTLRVVLNNDRISDLAGDLKEFLEKIMLEKQQLEVKKSSYEASFRISKSFNNVFYQQENDTRNNFPNDKEFSNFKSQRDQFYTIFKCWDANHLNHMWNFRTELLTKIQILFNTSDHPINMAHLAKLFVSQLLVSSNYNETSHTDIGVELKAHVDLQKFSKLTQRLVEPSNFSIDYQFPAKQAFFKDFILASSCVAFSEQVKIALLVELIQFNSSTYEVINLTSNESTDFVMEYVVRPEVLSTMQVLAKFLGLLHAQPFLYPPSSGCLSIDKKQIELRNMVQPGFDVMGLLKVAISEKKLLITIPWIVQYLAMLDHITLQLDYYRNVLHLLYELYIYLGGRADLLRMRPTSVFILRTCLGWFFEGTNVAESYYVYRQNRTLSFSQLIEMKEISVLVPNALVSEFAHYEDKPMVVKSIKKENEESLALALDRCEKAEDINYNEFTVERTIGQFDPMLECILNVACPFLSEFRVTIMPPKYSKCVSRSGRYRHVTPKISEITSTQSPSHQPSQDSQSKLIEAFLHSQNLSVRRIIEFVIERTTSAVIKDAQIEILLPSKNEANKKVQTVSSTDILKVKKEILEIYSQANDAAMLRWNDELPSMVESRVKMALEALLPHETPEVVKKTCLSLILQKCQLKINDWRTTNLKNIDFYIKGIDVTVDKIVKANMLLQKPLSTNLDITVSTPCLSDILEDLQFWMHASSRRPELVEEGKIKMFLVDLQKIFDNVLPQSFYRIIGSSVVNLIQNLIENHSHIVSEDLLKILTTIWTVEGMHTFTQWHSTTTKKRIDSKQSSEEEDTTSEKQETPISPNLFSSLITISFIRSLKADESFDKLELLLLELIENNVITIDHLNELFVRIFKVEWNEKILSRISALLQTVSGRRNKKLKEDDGRSNLFMEALADFSRDIDSF